MCTQRCEECHFVRFLFSSQPVADDQTSTLYIELTFPAAAAAIVQKYRPGAFPFTFHPRFLYHTTPLPYPHVPHLATIISLYTTHVEYLQTIKKSVCVCPGHCAYWLQVNAGAVEKVAGQKAGCYPPPVSFHLIRRSVFSVRSGFIRPMFNESPYHQFPFPLALHCFKHRLSLQRSCVMLDSF